MAEGEHPSVGGLGGSLRRILSSFLSTLETRVELLSVELQEEKERLIAILIRVAALIFFGVLAVIMVTITVVMACPARARLPVLTGFCLLYLTVTVLAGRGLRKQVRDRPKPFSATAAELKKDADWLRSKK